MKFVAAMYDLKPNKFPKRKRDCWMEMEVRHVSVSRRGGRLSSRCQTSLRQKAPVFYWKNVPLADQVASKLASHRMVRLLLSFQADPAKKTSQGRTALDLAETAENDSAKRQVVDTLLNWEKTINMREFRSICSSKVSKVCGQMPRLPRAVPAYRICL